MKSLPIIVSILLALGSIAIRAEEVVSIWSQGAGAYVSVKGQTTLAASPSVGQTETFVLTRSQDGAARDQITIVDMANRQRGTFILEELGHRYCAFKKGDGRYLSSDKTGRLALKAGEVGDGERFAVVPMRKGAKVCIRAYQGWEGKILVDHPADFPTLKANVNTLQITPLLDPPHKKFWSKELLADYRKCFSTDAWETEYILNKTPAEIKANPRKSNLRGLLQRVILMEELGYEVDYLIVYREPLVENHAPGPWSDKRILAQSDVDAVNKMFKDAHAKGTIKRQSYRLVALAYQFDTKSANDSFCGHLTKGLDDKTRAFIKKNFWGLSVEVNSHDWSRKKEDIDTAMAAEWCKSNRLHLIITSGGSGKDKGYKTMYEKVFAAMKTHDVDPASPWLHYILHHVFQPYGDRLPEWQKDTTAENAKWLIEKVQKIVVSPRIDAGFLQNQYNKSL
jgi:hypothetical protein